MLICKDDLLSPQNTSGSPEEREADHEFGILKCLQIDLARFGLEKHGLVNKFSRVLENAGINHMYSSTYKTANLLVRMGVFFKKKLGL